MIAEGDGAWSKKGNNGSGEKWLESGHFIGRENRV